MSGHAQVQYIPPLAGKDPIVLAFLPGGGGLLTYLKPARPKPNSKVKAKAKAKAKPKPQSKKQRPHPPEGREPPALPQPVPVTERAAGGVANEEVVFVHTLNTESGLIRKIEALQLEDVVVIPHGLRRDWFFIVLRIIQFLEHADKNRSASPLVLWAKHMTRASERTRQRQ